MLVSILPWEFLLAWYLCGKFLLHIPCCFHFYLGNLSNIPCSFIFLWGVSLTHPRLASIWSGEFLLHILYRLHFMSGVSLTHPVLPLILSVGFSYISHACFIFTGGVSLTHPVLAAFLSGSFSYTSHAGFFYVGTFSNTTLALFFYGDFLLHIPCWLFLFFYWGVSLTDTVLASIYQVSFSYTSRVGFIFIWGVCLTHPMLVWYPMLVWFYCGEFLLHTPCWLLFLIWGVSLIHPVLFSFSSAESLLYIFLLHFYVWNFSYTSHTDFFFIWGVSLTQPVLFIWGVSLIHPVLASILMGNFSYTFSAGLIFYLGTLSYTSDIGFIFLWGVSLTHPVLVSFLSGQFLLHIPCWL